MPGTLTQQIPDATVLLNQRANVTGQTGALLEALGGLSRGDDSSPLGTVTTVLGGLGSHLDIDVSGLSTRLPAAITTIGNAIPPGAVEFVRSIESDYQAARAFLHDSALAQAVSQGGSLQDVALAVISDALNLFRTRLTDLGANLISADTLQQVESVFTAFGDFRNDFPTHRSDFPAFLTRYLLGVTPDLFDAPRAHLNTVFSGFDPCCRQTRWRPRSARCSAPS